MTRPFFPLFFKDRDKLKYLSFEQRGELFTALFAYAADGEEPSLEGISGFAFEVFREGIDQSLLSYEEACQKNRENGKKGGRPRKNPTVSKKTEQNPTVSNVNRKKPNKTQKTETEAEAEAEAEEEVEEEVEAEAEAEAEGVDEQRAPALSVVKNYFADLFGRQPSNNFLSTICAMSIRTQDICRAIQQSKDKRARNPEGYATRILQSWEVNGIPSQQAHVGHDSDNKDRQLEPWEAEWLEQFQRRTKQNGEQTNVE